MVGEARRAIKDDSADPARTLRKRRVGGGSAHDAPPCVR